MGEQVAAPTANAALPCERERLGYELLLILSEPHVQVVLELSPQQRQQIRTQAEAFMERAAAQLAGNPSGVSPPPPGEQASLQLARTYGRQALGVLSTSQQQRLDQVLFQLASLDIYSLPEFRAALDLTPDQRAALNAVRQAAVGRLAELRRQWKAGTLSRSVYEDAVQRELVASDDASDGVLSPRQFRLVQAWRGPRIDFGRMHLRLGIQSTPPHVRSR